MKNSKFRKSIHSKVHVSIRELLIKQRIAINLSQREVAMKLNVTHSLIGKIETGDRRLDTVEMVKYCKILEIEPGVVIELIEEILHL